MKKYKDDRYDINHFCPKTNKCLKSWVGWFPSNGATSIYFPQNVVGVLIANTHSLVTGYGKFGFHNQLWRFGLWKNLKLGEANKCTRDHYQ